MEVILWIKVGKVVGTTMGEREEEGPRVVGVFSSFLRGPHPLPLQYITLFVIRSFSCASVASANRLLVFHLITGMPRSKAGRSAIVPFSDIKHYILLSRIIE